MARLNAKWRQLFAKHVSVLKSLSCAASAPKSPKPNIIFSAPSLKRSIRQSAASFAVRTWAIRAETEPQRTRRITKELELARSSFVSFVVPSRNLPYYFRGAVTEKEPSPASSLFQEPRPGPCRLPSPARVLAGVAVEGGTSS